MNCEWPGCLQDATLEGDDLFCYFHAKRVAGLLDQSPRTPRATPTLPAWALPPDELVAQGTG